MHREFLLLGRVVVPSYGFLVAFRGKAILRRVRAQHRPDLFARCAVEAAALAPRGRGVDDALNVLAKIVLRTGRELDQLTAQDLLSYRAWELAHYGVGKGGVPPAWRILRGVADLGEYPSLRDAQRFAQRTTAELVDTHQLRCRPMRDMLVRYFDERRPGMDYSSFCTLVNDVVRNFWADIEIRHPDIDSLHLPPAVAEAWRQRLLHRLPDLLATWTQLLALTDHPTRRWEPKRLRLRILSLPADLARHAVGL